MRGRTGIGEYLDQVERRLPGLLSPQARLVGFGPPGSGAAVRLTARVYGAAEQAAIPLAARGQRLDAFFSPHYNAPLAIRVPLVVTVHDVIHLLFPGQLPRPRWLSHRYARWMLSAVCRKAAVILTPSAHTRSDLVRLLGIAPSKIRVTPLGVDPVFRPEPRTRQAAFRRAHGLTGGYLLAVGNLKPHKNHAGLIRAFAAARIPRLKLVIAGVGEPGLTTLRALAEQAGVAEAVVFVGGLSREALRRYYAGALAFVFPSFYEGFGIPPLEAMACGTPVVAAATSSIPDVVGSAALMIDPHREGSLARALRAVATNAGLRRRLIARGRARVARFSWDETARLTAEALREAAGA